MEKPFVKSLTAVAVGAGAIAKGNKKNYWKKRIYFI